MYSDRHFVFDKITFIFAHMKAIVWTCVCACLCVERLFFGVLIFPFFDNSSFLRKRMTNDVAVSLIRYSLICVSRDEILQCICYCPSKSTLKSIARHVCWTCLNRFVYIKQRVMNNWIKTNPFNAFMPIFIWLLQ